MKYIISILLIAICLSVQSQVVIKADLVKEDLENGVNSIQLVFHSNQLENELRPYHLELLTENVLTSPPVYNPKTRKQLTFELFTSPKQRQDILDYIFSNGLHDSLFFKLNETYVALDKPEVSIPISEVLCDFELFFESQEYGIMQLFIPIQNKQDAISILRDIRCSFRKRDRIAFDLIINELIENDA